MDSLPQYFSVEPAELEWRIADVTLEKLDPDDVTRFLSAFREREAK